MLVRKLMAIGVTVGVSLLLLEVLYRGYLGDWNLHTREPVVPNVIKKFDSRLGWALRPNSSGTSGRLGYDINYEINSKGLRDDETPYEKPAGVYRIVLLGDSRTFGYGVPVQKHFARLLEGYFEKVEVINLGVSGYGIDQELLSLRYEGLKYQPDLIIAYVAHYGGHRHMHDSRFGKHKPYFVRDEGKLILRNAEITKVEVPPHWLRHLHGTLRNYSRVYSTMFDTLRPGTDASAANRKDAQNFENPEFRQELFALGHEIVSEMKQTAEDHGARFLVVTQITELEVSCREAGIRVLNVSSALANRMYQLPDNLLHINESGNGALAWEIARYLAASEIIPLSHRSP